MSTDTTKFKKSPIKSIKITSPLNDPTLDIVIKGKILAPSEHSLHVMADEESVKKMEAYMGLSKKEEHATQPIARIPVPANIQASVASNLMISLEKDRHETITKIAYYLYERRVEGHIDGCAHNDWCLAAAIYDNANSSAA